MLPLTNSQMLVCCRCRCELHRALTVSTNIDQIRIQEKGDSGQLANAGSVFGMRAPFYFCTQATAQGTLLAIIWQSEDWFAAKPAPQQQVSLPPA